MDDPSPSRIREAYEQCGRGPVAIVVKYDNWGFATNLEGLDLSGFFSILITPSSNAAAFVPEPRGFTPAHRRLFDLILLPDTTVDVCDPATLGELSAVRLPEVQAVLEILLEVVPAKDIHLVGLEEEMLRPLAALREQHGLPGVRPADLQRFVDKSVMKAWFGRHGIEAPSAVLVEGVPEDADELATLQATLQAGLRFPLFIKPSDGVASASAARLETPADLGAWLGSHRGIDQRYVLEEFIVGTEIFAYGLAQQGELSILSIDEMHMPMFEAKEAGEPIAELSLDRSSAGFERIARFVQQVFQALSPVPDGSFVVQLMRSRIDGRLQAIEVSARVPGDVAPCTLCWATGLNIESAHIALQLPGARPVEVPKLRRDVATLLFPRRAGVVRAMRALPTLHPGTEMKATWYFQPGQALEAPQTYDDIAGYVQLRSADHAALAEDFRTLVAFRPLVLEGETP